ncbi:hypothetical protein KSP39_PZI022844 [Platanthera zijinensis]|uniref:Uncharacterized protein n=1 Tax=Platanthera zijinensis TaxID=2320716 RepID=A0AAP0AVF9_9ASPA
MILSPEFGFPFWEFTKTARRTGRRSSGVWGHSNAHRNQAANHGRWSFGGWEDSTTSIVVIPRIISSRTLERRSMMLSSESGFPFSEFPKTARTSASTIEAMTNGLDHSSSITARIVNLFGTKSGTSMNFRKKSIIEPLPSLAHINNGLER